MAAREGHCRRPDAENVRNVRIPRKIPDAFGIDELRRMLEAARRAKGYYADTGISLAGFWEAWILVGYCTGLRTAEMLAIRLADALNGSWVQYQSKNAAERICLLNEQAIEAVKRIRHPERGRLFAWEQTREQLYNHWHKHVVGPALGIKRDRRHGPQKLRRTAASFAEQQIPGSATRFLGHMTSDMAARHYLDPRITQKRPPLPPINGTP